MSPRVDGDLLDLYLGDHLTGSTAGAARITDMATRHSDTPMGPELAAIAKEIREERVEKPDEVREERREPRREERREDRRDDKREDRREDRRDDRSDRGERPRRRTWS